MDGETTGDACWTTTTTMMEMMADRGESRQQLCMDVQSDGRMRESTSVRAFNELLLLLIIIGDKVYGG